MDAVTEQLAHMLGRAREDELQYNKRAARIRGRFKLIAILGAIMLIIGVLAVASMWYFVVFWMTLLLGLHQAVKLNGVMLGANDAVIRQVHILELRKLLEENLQVKLAL